MGLITLTTEDRYRGLWTANTFYKQYDVVFQDGSLWVADADFTSGGVFDSANWTCAECPAS